MKGKKIVEVGLAAIIALSGVASAAAPAFAAPNVIYPNVQSYTKDSDTFTLPKKSRLLVLSNEKTLNKLAEEVGIVSGTGSLGIVR